MFPQWVFTAFAAFILAATAGFFSITGLGALYAGAFWAIVVMGAVIEIGKISATFWLHQHYKTASKMLTTGMGILVVAAMLITSGGTFGFLSQSHLEQEAPVATSTLKIERIDLQLKSNTATIAREENRLKQLDDIVNKLIEYDKISGPTGSRAVRNGQAVERAEIQDSIDGAYNKIDELNDEKLPLQQKVANVEAKLGPVKYLAALFGADTQNTVIYFTLLIVLLLDPFAILLVIATSISYNEWMNKKEQPGTPLETKPLTYDEKPVIKNDDRETEPTKKEQPKKETKPKSKMDEKASGWFDSKHKLPKRT